MSLREGMGGRACRRLLPWLCGVWVVGAWAQQAPPPVAPAGAVPRVEDIRRGTEAEPRRAATAQAPAAPQRREIEDVAGLSITVKAFRVVGLTRVAAAEIEPLLARYTGPDKTFQDLRDAVDEVKTQLAARGLPLAYVYLPEQEVKDGIVDIEVIEGRLGRVRLEVASGAGIDEATLRRYTDRLVAGQVITVREVERVLFLLRDLYGVEVRSEFTGGSERGTADLVVKVAPAPRFEGLLELDNAGSRITGEFRATAGVRWNNPLGLGDSLSARLISSLAGGLDIGLLSYAAPLGGWGTKIGASFTAVRYEIDASVVGVPIDGRGHVATVFGLHPLVRSRNLNLFAQASWDAKRFDEHTGGVKTERSIDLLTLALVGDSADRGFGGGVNSFSAALGMGTLERPFNGLSVPPSVDRRFEKLQLGYSRLQQLPLERTLLLLRYAGQYTSRNLDPYEQFTLGGAGAVRAYGVAEGAGDSGEQLSAELRWSPTRKQFDAPGNVALLAFFDWGRVRLFSDAAQANAPAGSANRRTFGGPGFGLLWEVPGYVSVRATLAWPTIGEPVNDTSPREPRLYFLISKPL